MTNIACAPLAAPATSAAPWLPPVPRPPHDPYTLLLDARVGWHSLAGPPGTIAPAPGDGAMTMRPLPGAGRGWADGSFGGFVLPPHLAWLGDESCDRTLALYDAVGHRLLKLDRCECGFVEWLCLRADDPRLPLTFGGMSSTCLAGAGRLALLDTQRRRVIVLNAATGALRGAWCPAGGLWQPSALAHATDGRLWVADAASGELLGFSRIGQVAERVPGAGTVQQIAFDAQGTPWLLRADGSVVVRDAAGGWRPVSDSPAWAAPRFSRLPLLLAADGSVEAGALCTPTRQRCWFDLRGERLTTPPATPADAYAEPAQWFCGPLDSGIADCVWDRLVLDAEVPEHAALWIEVLAADTELPAEVVRERSDWQLVGRVDGVLGEPSPRTGLDWMLRAPPGRWLWLRVSMHAGVEPPRLARLRIDYPRISWRRYLPAVFGAEPGVAEFTDRFLALFDRGFRQIETQVDQQARWLDPASAPPAFLTFLASWIGAEGAAALPLARRRAFVKHAARAYVWRGTLQGLTQTLYLFLGLARWCGWEPARAGCVPCPLVLPARYAWRPPRLLLEHHALRRWLFLGAGRLSDGARLWGTSIVGRSQLGAPQPARAAYLPGTLGAAPDDQPCASGPYSTARDALAARGRAQLGAARLKTAQDPWRDPFHVYAHQLAVFVPAVCVADPTQRRALRQLLALEAPAHVQVHLHEVVPRFRVGVQAMLGLDAVIGWRARAPRLDENPLGRATVLDGERGGDRGRASLRVGARRVGMNTTVQ